jgi:CRISPR/Cas system-associated endoribonuclease Cas2
MLTKPTVTEKIIRGVACLEEYFYYPKSDSQLANWDKNMAYRSYKRKKAGERRDRKRIMEALNRLERADYLSYSANTKEYQLTPKGWLKYLYYYSIRKQKRQKTKGKKSKTKYVIIFDIPEKFRRFRDVLRSCLKCQGCQLIQNSVYLCNHADTFEWIKKVVCNCELDKHVLFIEANKVN